MADEKIFEMSVAVGLAGAMMTIVPARRESLEPILDVLNEAVFGVVDVNAGGYVHRRNQHHALADAALLQNLFGATRDVDELALFFGVEPEILSVGLHDPNQISPEERV